MRKFFSRHAGALCILVFLVLSVFITHRNLGWEKTFAGEDYGVWYDFPQRAVALVLSTWDSLFAPGKINVTSMTSLLWTHANYFLYLIGIPPLIIERVIYILFFFIASSSMFFLLKLLLSIYAPQIPRRLVLLGAFCAAIFYALNHFTLFLTTLPISPYHLPYVLFPLLFSLFIQNVQIVDNRSTRILFVLCLVVVLSGNPSNVIVILTVLFGYFVFFYRKIRLSQTHPYRFFIFAAIVIMLATSYITLPAMSIGSNPYGVINFSRDFLTSVRFNSGLTSFSHLFTLAGYVAWNSYAYFATYTENIWFLLLGNIFLIISIIALLLPGQKRIKLFFAFLLIASLFLAKGTHPPFEAVFEYLFTHIPLFGMFRSVYSKFSYITAFSYAVLIGFFVSTVSTKFKFNRRAEFMTALVIVLATVIYAFPFITGSVIQSSNGDVLTQIPDEYMKIGDTLTGDGTDAKVLALPPAPKGSGLILKWAGDNIYIGQHPDFTFLNRPVLDGYWFIREGYFGLSDVDSWRGTAFESHLDEIMQYLSIHNIRYIFLHKDFVESYSFGPGTSAIIEGAKKFNATRAFLATLSDIEIIKDTPYFTLYRLGESYIAPHIYVAHALTYADTKPDKLFDVMNLTGIHKATDGVKLIQNTNSVASTEAQFIDSSKNIFVEAKQRLSTGRQLLTALGGATFFPDPFAHWLPDSFIYPLIVVKDNLSIWQSRNNPQEQFDKRLFYTLKRLKEIVAFTLKHGSLPRSEFESYKKDMTSLFAYAAVKHTTGDEIGLYITKLKYSLPFHYESIYKVTLPKDIQDELLSYLDSLPSQRSDGSSSIDEAFMYDARIPVEGTYEVYIRADKRSQWVLSETKHFEKGVQTLRFDKKYFGNSLTGNIDATPENSLFFVSFDYRYNLAQYTPQVHFWDDKAGSLLTAFNVAFTGPKISHYETFFATATQISDLTVHPNAKEIYNIRIERIYEPEILFKKIPQNDSISLSVPVITFQKESPTKYRLHIEHAVKPFALIFSEFYNSDWKAYPLPAESTKLSTVHAAYFGNTVSEVSCRGCTTISNLFETWAKKSIPAERHFPMNGYANGWYVIPEDLNNQETYDMVLEFYPQRFFYVGIIIAFLTYSILFLSLVLGVAKHLKQKHV